MNHIESYKELTATALAAILAAHTPVYLLDVREPMELVVDGAIAGVVNLPMGQLVRRVGELPADKGAEIVVVCRSGARSANVAQFLASQCGFTNVFNLEGGIVSWKRHGFATERDETLL